MHSPSDQIRFARSCSEAMFGYSNAMTAASGLVAEHMVTTWLEVLAPPVRSDVTRGLSRKERGRARRPKGRKARLAAGRSSGAALGMPWLNVPGLNVLAPGLVPRGNGGQFPNVFDPFGIFGSQPIADPMAMAQAWIEMDWMRAPASWPMAYGMMAFGVPRGVALPTADANLAAMDACSIAAEGLQKAFPHLPQIGGPAPVRNFFEDARKRRAGGGRKARLASASAAERSASQFGFEPIFPFAFFTP